MGVIDFGRWRPFPYKEKQDLNLIYRGKTKIEISIFTNLYLLFHRGCPSGSTLEPDLF